jgi:hypothetical protein
VLLATTTSTTTGTHRVVKHAAARSLAAGWPWLGIILGAVLVLWISDEWIRSRRGAKGPHRRFLAVPTRSAAPMVGSRPGNQGMHFGIHPTVKTNVIGIRQLRTAKPAAKPCLRTRPPAETATHSGRAIVRDDAESIRPCVRQMRGAARWVWSAAELAARGRRLRAHGDRAQSSGDRPPALSRSGRCPRSSGW